MAEEGTNQQPIIIKRVKKGGHGGHHGGSWKVAYADFVTAMMAFFLLLWLLNATTDEQKRGIADYFAPTIASRSSSGSGGVLGGQTIETEGAMVANKDSPSVTVVLEDPAPSPSESEVTEDTDNAEPAPLSDTADSPGAQDTADFTEAAARKRIAAEEDRQFREAEFQIRQAIQDVPDIQQLAQNLIIDRTPEGLRIQIVDQEKLSMFPRGSSNMVEQAHKLMDLVAKVIEQLPNKVSITGHTDSTPFSNNNASYTNWELSTDRANASRRALLAAGVPEERFATVVGKADQEPLNAEDPTSPQNRRISIVLLREAPQLADAALSANTDSTAPDAGLSANPDGAPPAGEAAAGVAPDGQGTTGGEQPAAAPPIEAAPAAEPPATH